MTTFHLGWCDSREGGDCDCHPNDLESLIEEARAHVMTEDEKRKQAASFVYGNLKLDGCDVTREGVSAGMDKLQAGNKQ